MGEVGNELFFAPGIKMQDLPLDDPLGLVDAFECRLQSFFLRPISHLKRLDDDEIGALFASALLVAALIESVARVEKNWSKNGDAISTWLEANAPEFRATVSIDGRNFTVASVFEHRFRDGLAHSGYVASRGRLSREIDGIYRVNGDVVTVDPFRLAELVSTAVTDWLEALREGKRDANAFQHRIRNLFEAEVIATKAASAS